MQRLGVVLSVVLCTAWLDGAVANSPSEIDEVDASVSSAIARTMASIEGRDLNADLPSHRAHRRPLGLSKLSHREATVAKGGHRRLRGKKQMVIPKADAPKQLAGYLGWSSSKAAAPVKEPSFSTHWKTTGSKAADSESVYMRDLEHGRVEQEAPTKEEAPKKEQALFVNSASSTAFSKMMEDQSVADEFPSMDWGAQKKAAQPAKVEQHTSGNRYLNSIGWTEPEKVVASKDNPYLLNLSDDPEKRKILAAAEVAEKKTKSNNYLDQLMPSAAYEISLQ